MTRCLAVLAGALVAGCSIGAPPGFSGGDSWTFPLVGPLEEGVLIVPVHVNDMGPFLFAIDPDSPTSAVDDALVSELSLHNGVGPKMLDETDTNRPSHMAEVSSFKLGVLTVRSRTVAVFKTGSFNVAGRQIRGTLGRDVIADSLVFGFDRDRGVAFLATQKGFTAPEAATVMSYDIITNRLRVEYPPASRRVATVQINDKKFKMHLDLGAVTSQLRPGLWSKAGMQSIPVDTEMRDEVGTSRVTKEGSVANTVSIGSFTAGGVLFAPYDDKRWEDEDLDGTLGLNFFRMLSVSANWDAEKYYLVPRGDAMATVKERIDRWGSPKISGCAQVGCVAIEMVDPAAAPPATQPDPAVAPSGAPGADGPPGGGAVAPEVAKPVVLFKRDASAAGVDLELLVVAVAASGQPADLPRLVVNMPAGVDQLSNQLDPSYSGTKLVIVDLSPFPRTCARAGGGCIQSLASSR